MVLMCDVADLGRAVAASHDGAWAVGANKGARTSELVLQASGRPCIYLYDDTPGGTGLSGRLAELGAAFLRHVIRVVRGCRCGGACPTCVGTEIAVLTPGATAGLPDGHGVRGAPEVRDDGLVLLEGLLAQAQQQADA